ncbi:hypothetical protein CCM_04013 [Cordyceps militaris CM01]|uniref:Secreted protein n=1 Tax=Cordyceps militaris (strain CM01) TaxID=983644 RepID=G3JDG5_CORMM|nr:uncharacterized protein CCM_04013 [Cordyceps militaris CM01]EGX92640.1 hypothetical protein CCM_04013 [Cordyceps militaris CM01]
MALTWLSFAAVRDNVSSAVCCVNASPRPGSPSEATSTSFTLGGLMSVGVRFRLASFHGFGGEKTPFPSRCFATGEVLRFAAMIVGFDTELPDGGMPAKKDRVMPMHVLDKT